MSSTWSIINAQKATTVAIGGLTAAITAAIPGEVITVSGGGADTALTLSSIAKTGYGVCVSLPEAQKVRLTLADVSGLHFFGGTWAADTVSGDTAASNYGVRINAGCAKLSWHGGIFDRNANGIWGTGVTDLLVRNCLWNVARGDHIQLQGAARIAVEDNNMLAGAKADTFCYFNSSTPPTEGGSQGACTGAGGTWEDSFHPDTGQFLNNCTDVSVLRNTVASYGAQGFNGFAANYALSLVERVLVDGNTLSDMSSWAVNFAGTDIDVRNNTVAASPFPLNAPLISVTRDGAGRIQGGLNTAPGFVNPSGVNLAAGAINGDSGVVAPARPNITLPPWRPATPVPTIPNTNLVPTFVPGGGGGIRPDVVALGTWAAINRGMWIGANGATWEFRWKRNGTLIAGVTAQSYQVASPVVAGETLTAEVRGTNANGVGAWTQVGSVVVA